MQERMSWDQIRKSYPEQWVILSDVEFAPDNNVAVVSAVINRVGEPTTEDYNDAYDGRTLVRFTTPEKTLQMGALRI